MRQGADDPGTSRVRIRPHHAPVGPESGKLGRKRFADIKECIGDEPGRRVTE
jgi:hypothetical protein